MGHLSFEIWYFGNCLAGFILGVKSLFLVVPIVPESFRLGSAAFGYEFEWCEALGRLTPASTNVGVYEVAQMSSELIGAAVVVVLDGGLIAGPVQSLHRTICQRLVGLGQPMVDTVLEADLVEAMNPKAGGQSVAIARQIGELTAVVGEDYMEPIGHSRDQPFVEDNLCRTIGQLQQLNENALRRSVYPADQIDFAFLRPACGNVDMGEADRLGLEPRLRFLVVFNIRQAADAITLQASLQ